MGYAKYLIPRYQLQPFFWERGVGGRGVGRGAAPHRERGLQGVLNNHRMFISGHLAGHDSIDQFFGALSQGF